MLDIQVCNILIKLRRLGNPVQHEEHNQSNLARACLGSLRLKTLEELCDKCLKCYDHIDKISPKASLAIWWEDITRFFG
jgi:hypothetical protein